MCCGHVAGRFLPSGCVVRSWSHSLGAVSGPALWRCPRGSWLDRPGLPDFELGSKVGQCEQDWSGRGERPRQGVQAREPGQPSAEAPRPGTVGSQGGGTTPEGPGRPPLRPGVWSDVRSSTTSSSWPFAGRPRSKSIKSMFAAPSVWALQREPVRAAQKAAAQTRGADGRPLSLRSSEAGGEGGGAPGEHTCTSSALC